MRTQAGKYVSRPENFRTPPGNARRSLGPSPAAACEIAAGDRTVVLELEYALGGAQRQAQHLRQAELAAVAVAETTVAQVGTRVATGSLS